MLLFAGPMILGNLLQQCYNIVDMLIVGRALGAGALAAVGSAYSLMTFLTSVLIGMCMGSGSLFSYSIGKRDTARLQYDGIIFLYWNRDDRDEHCCVCVYETDPEYSSDTGGHLWNDAGICMVYILGHLFCFSL